MSLTLNTLRKLVAAGSMVLLATGAGMTANAQTSVHSKVTVAGSFNNFDTFTPNMTLVGNNLWQADLTITNTSFRFKFATENFAFNWGRWNQPHSILPQSETATSDGGDIYVTNLTGNTQIRFLFDDSTRDYAVLLLNNIGTNLLFNPSFEQQGGQGIDARYWEYSNPNFHGARVANAQRQGSNWNYYVKSGAWLGLIGASWAGSSSGAWWQDVPVEDGVTYEASAWFSAEGAPNAWQPAQAQELKIEFFDFSRQNMLSYSAVSLTNVIGSTQFVQRVISTKAPAGARWARLVFYASGVGNVGTLRMDDASIQATSAKREQNFNDWQSANTIGCYSFAGWEACAGSAVGSYTNGSTVFPLSRSGLAFSLTNPTASNEGSYIRSPRFADGIGSVSFYYRHGDQGPQVESPNQPVHFKVQKSLLGDFWTTIGEVSNAINTTFNRYDVFANETLPHYIRIVHAGGSTNRLIIDDISVALPGEQPRLMTFDTWTNAPTAGQHFHLGWSLATGRVSAAVNRTGLGGQISGSTTNVNFLRSPTFTNGYGAISFLYRLGNDSLYKVGFALEASSNGTQWTTLDTVTGITNINWVEYNRYALVTTPHSIRIRNLSETNISPNNAATISENFPNAPTPPPGWSFNGIGVYTGSGNPSPALKMDATGAQAVSPGLVNPTNLTFWGQGQSISPDNTLLVEGFRTGTWYTITLLSNIANSGTTYGYTISTNTEQVRFTYAKNGDGNFALDNVRITGAGFGPNPPRQSLALEDVYIAPPDEFRLQDFNTWPNKPDYGSGTTFHQGWTLEGQIAVTDTKAYEGQAAKITRVVASSGGNDYVVDFEGAGETKTTYTTGGVKLSGLFWEFTESLIGDLANDYKTGLRSARLRGRNGSAITMTNDLNGGLGTITFNYRRYGTDTSQQAWAVEVSTNSGSSWTQIGANITPSDIVQTFSGTVNTTNKARIRVRLTTTPGTSGERRFNIDDLVATGYNPGGGNTVDSYIKSHAFAGGVGNVNFRYRHELDSTPPSGSTVTLHIQTSTNGTVWKTVATQVVNNAQYQLSETFINNPTATFARVIAVAGTGAAYIDNVEVTLPQPPANVLIAGYHEPALPFTNDTVTLFASLTPLFGARDFAVTSYYRVGTSGAFTAIGMAPIGGNVYQATSSIPAKAPGTIVQYYISSWFEGAGASLTRPARYPTNAPTTTAFYAIPRTAPGQVWINEVDYRSRYFEFDWDTWTDVVTNRAFVELSGRSGVNLNGWRIDLLDGTTTNLFVYGSYSITNFTLANETNGFGFFVLGGNELGMPPSDMLMGANYMDAHAPGVILLYNEVGLLEDSWSYGGLVPPYDDIPLVDPDPITFTNSADLANSVSLSLIGVGTIGSEFDWGTSPTVPTPGSGNQGQTFAVAPVISLNTLSMTFYYIPGSFNPASQPLIVSNSGGSAMSYSLSTAAGWLSFTDVVVSNLAPGATKTHQITASTAGLTGNRTAQITISGTASNSPQVVNVNLLESSIEPALVHYKFDEGSGTITLNQGTIGATANGILSNGTWTIEAQGASGNLGDFAYLSTVQTARVRTAAPVSNLNKLVSFTVSGWVRPTTTNNPARPIIGNLGGTNGFEIRTTTNGSNFALVSPNGVTSVVGATISSTNSVLVTNQWAFFAITFNSTNTGNNAVVFHRGTRETASFIASTHARGSLGASGISTSSFYVGGNGTNSFTGWIDDVRVHTGILASATIEAIRQDGAFRLTGTGTAPVIEDQPESVLVSEGLSAQFIVGAVGIPFPLYQWRKNGVIINGATDDLLYFDTVALADTGTYDVIVYNANGSITSQVATLSVFGGAYFILQPQSQTAYEGETVTFTGGALPETGTTYQWKFKTNNLAAQTNASLILTNVTMSMTGTYYLVATYDASSLTSTGAVLTVVPFVFDGTVGGGMAQASPAGGMVVQWPSLSNRTYNLLWSSNLLAGTHNFITIATNLPATPSLNTYTDNVNGAKSIGIYRVITAP